MSKNQRVAVLGLLLLVLAVLYLYPLTRPELPPAELSVFLSSLFLLSFTTLLLEHFFSRPTDVLAAGVSILLLLIPSQTLLMSWGPWYWGFLYYEFTLVLLATVALLLLTEGDEHSSRNRASHVLKAISTRVGSGKIQYFLLFLLSLVFFVEPGTPPFLAFLCYSIVILLLEPQKISLWLPEALKTWPSEIGEILAVQGGTSFLVRLHAASDSVRPSLGDLLEFRYGVDDSGEHRRGVVVEKMFLDQGQWIRVVCHPSISAGSAHLPDLARCRPGGVYKRADGDASPFFGALVGFVADGSEVGTLRFLQAGKASVQEGDLVEVATSSGSVVYQVVNGRVDSESLDARNEADFIVGEAVQLGRWDASRGTFDRHGWVPPARAPVIQLTDITPPQATPEEITLGCIPGTNIPVLLNRREAISHHTAILGVTGVGKSMFARHLVRQLGDDDMRIIVVDFTREWKDKLTGAATPLIIDETAAIPLRHAIRSLTQQQSEFKNKQNQGEIAAQKKILYDGFRKAIDEFLKGDDGVRVFELPEVSNTEGVLEYTQWFFQTLFRVAQDSRLHGRRVCVVLEEAHTVIPEWNFVGLADKSSQSLINNISQIALQGRKYDVGFIVIAQRTASVSKTVLTQCNTIIAFQCFDGTSLEFLGHYLPLPVIRALPNLGIRRAVAVGKAIRGSVPLIFQVPDLSGSEPAGRSVVATELAD